MAEKLRCGYSLRQVLLSSRPLSWVNTAFPFLAASLLATRHIDAFTVLGTMFFLLPYNLLMYGINDVFDYESDLRNPRKGGVEGALLDPRLHRTVILAGVGSAIPLGVAMIAAGGVNPLAWLVLAVSVSAVVIYSAPPLRTKEKPLWDSITSSIHFVSPAVYALVTAGVLFTSELWLLVLAFFLWGMASHAFGAVQDVLPDRVAGLSSIATVWGAARTVRFAIGLWLGAVIALAVAAMMAWAGGHALEAGLFALASVLPAPYVLAVWRFRSVSDEHSGESHRAWKRFLALNFAVGTAATLLLNAWFVWG